MTKDTPRWGPPPLPCMNILKHLFERDRSDNPHDVVADYRRLDGSDWRTGTALSRSRQRTSRTNRAGRLDADRGGLLALVSHLIRQPQRQLSAIVALMPFDEILNARHHGRRASIPRGLSR